MRQSEKYNLGIADMDTITSKLYSHLDMGAGSGTVFTDLSGNGHHLTYQNDPSDPGGWNADSYSWDSSPASNDYWVPALASEYRFDNQSYTSLYVYRFSLDVLLSGINVSLICRRGVGVGEADEGFQHLVLASERVGMNFYAGGGSGTITSPATAVTIGEIVTVGIYYDSTNDLNGCVIAGDDTANHIQWEADTDAPGVVAAGIGTQIACLGQRSASRPSERLQDLTMYDCQCYEDTAGGAISGDINDIIRWMHNHPLKEIPAIWW